MNIRGLLILGTPVAGLVLLVAMAIFRPGAPERASARSSVERKAVPVVYTTPEAAPRPGAAPSDVIARAMEDDRLRSTFQNYRTAMATGNRPLADALRPVLSRDREKALRLAREAVARSSSEVDRRASLLTLESLER